jgi:hypothetical protein
MNTTALQEEEMYQLLDKAHNPPPVQDQREENIFQAEIRMEYDRLVECLSTFGEEGDYYGVSDFAVRPDLRDRPTVKAPPAPHIREFAITILTEQFYRSDFLEALCQFLLRAPTDYRIVIGTDFDPNNDLMVFLTADLAQIFCTNSDELERLNGILGKL